MEKIFEIIAEEKISEALKFSEEEKEKYRVSFDETKSERDRLEYALQEVKQVLGFLIEKEDTAGSLFIPEHLNENQLQQRELKLKIQELEEKLSLSNQKVIEIQRQLEKTEEVLLVLQKIQEAAVKENETVAPECSEAETKIQNELSCSDTKSDEITTQSEHLPNSEVIQQLLLIAHKVEFVLKLVGIDEIRTKLELSELKTIIQHLTEKLKQEEIL